MLKQPPLNLSVLPISNALSVQLCKYWSLIEKAISRTNIDLEIVRRKQSDETFFRAKAKWDEYGEKSNKYFLNLNKKYRKQKVLSKISCDGATFRGHNEVVNGITYHWFLP